MSIKDCKIIQLPKISDPRGNLTVVEGMRHIPFEIKRVYYLYNVPPQMSRGEHGHKKLQQVVIAMSGSFEIMLDDGYGRQKYSLNIPNEGLYIPSMMWRELYNFSSDAVCLVLASDFYDEDDYYRNYDEFIKAVKNDE